MGIIGRILRLSIVAFGLLIGSLSAVSVLTYARYGRTFRNTLRAATAYTTLFYGVAYAVWRFCGGKRQYDRDRDRGL